MKPYPIFLVGLENKHCIVIGGGHEAESKIRGLLDCDATVTVISNELTPQLQAWAEEGAFTWLKRNYQPGDLRGAFLVIAERATPEINARIFEEAETTGTLINVMDDVEHCTFVAGSVHRQGPLVISISTSGAAPALAVRMRQRFQQEVGPEYAEFLTLLQSLRAPMAEQFPKFSERRERWYQLVDSDVLDLLRNGNREEALAHLVEIAGDQVAQTIFEQP